MKLKSHALLFKDFDSTWYKKWAEELKQDKNHLDNHAPRANKFWQNAVICQALFERKKLKSGKTGIGFGVGQERLPATFAKHHVKVLATDQDFTTEKAEHWSKHELATGLQSLNKLSICDPQLFEEQVKYMSVDMTRIPEELEGNYDFLWSNCSLGHLGSITPGLNFIESSLRCLKAGGVAVHTTEVNILSDEQTLTTGNTVIFRLRDIYQLLLRLTANGYVCSALRFDLGHSADDFRINMRPKFGNDYSKIQVGGFVLTQVTLIITKPKWRNIEKASRKLRLLQLKLSYTLSLWKLGSHKRKNINIKQLLHSQTVLPEALSIIPSETHRSVEIKKDSVREIFVEYKNESPGELYSFYGHLINTAPTVLATSNPIDRKSHFANSEWVSSNRASSDFYVKDEKAYKPIDRVQQGQTFAFRLVLDAHKLKQGHYKEYFKIVQENLIWVFNSEVEISIKVI